MAYLTVGPGHWPGEPERRTSTAVPLAVPFETVEDATANPRASVARKRAIVLLHCLILLLYVARIWSKYLDGGEARC